MPDPEKISPQEFAAKIKSKYPEYKDVDDVELTNRMIDKYPEYKDQVNFGAPVKKKDSGVISDDGSKTLKVSEVLSGKQEVLPSNSNSASTSVQKQIPTKTPGNYFAVPRDIGIIPQAHSVNAQGTVGNGATKSNLIKSVDDQLDEHLPAENPQTKQTRDDVLKSFQDNDIDKIIEVRDGIVGTYKNGLFKAQEDLRNKSFSATPAGQPLPLDIKAQIDAEHNLVSTVAKEKIDKATDVFNEYARSAIVDKHLNPPSAEAKAAIQGFDINPAISKEVYQSIGKDIQKYQIPNTKYSSGNQSYDQTREGLEAVIHNGKLEINDLIDQGKVTDNPALLKLAQEKAVKLDNHQKILSTLDQDYPDVQVQKTARYLSDIMHDQDGFRFTTSREDVLKAAKIANEIDPTFMEKYGKYVDVVAESEEPSWFRAVGLGPLGQLSSGMISRSGIAYQLDQSIKQWVLAKTGDVATLLDDKGIEHKATEAAESPLLQGPSASGGTRDKVVLGPEGTYVEKANEDYGKISWNNAVRSFSHAVPGLLEWIAAEKAIGGIVGEIASTGKIADAAGAASGLSNIGREGELLKAATTAEVPYNQAAGLVGASYISGYESNRRLADSVIDDKAGVGDAKKTAFAHLTTLMTAGVFHLLGASPNKIIEESLSNRIKNDVLSTLEEANFKTLDASKVAQVLQEVVLPRAKSILKGAGVSLKEGATMAAAGDASTKLTQLATAIVDPKKADFGSLEENVTGFIGQALTMSLFPALGHIASKGGTMPYVAKDALYDAALHDNIIIDDIHKKMEEGAYDKDQGALIVKAVRSMKESVQDAMLQQAKDGTPLSTKQIKDWATADFRKKVKDLFKSEGSDLNNESVDNEVKDAKKLTLEEQTHHKIEDTEVFKSIEPIAGDAEKPENYLDIEGHRKYKVVVDGEEKVVTGETLQTILADSKNHEKWAAEEISKPVELRPEITQGNLTENEYARIKDLDAKQNPVIENNKVVKPGEALSDPEQAEYDSLKQKSEGAVHTEYDFKGVRDDDFAKKYLTPKEYDNWHELDKVEDPEAKQIISDKKQDLLSLKTENDGKETTSKDEGRQEGDVKNIQLQPIKEGVAEEAAPSIKENVTAVRGSDFTEADNADNYTPIGYYKGTHFYTGEGAEESAAAHGKNITKIDVSDANLYHIDSDEAASELKKKASDAGFHTTEGSGHSESEYLKQEGYDGIRRGKEVIIFDKKKFEKKNENTKDTKPAAEEVNSEKVSDKPEREAEESDGKGKESESAPVKSPEPPKERTPADVKETPGEEWTAIRKEKLKEIQGATEIFDKERSQHWKPIIESALAKLQDQYPDKNLYDASRIKVKEFEAKYDNKIPFNPTTEDLAVMQYFKMETERRINQIEGWNSEDDIARQAAVIQFADYNEDLLAVLKAINPREAGTAFGFRASEARLDPRFGLQVRRMEMLAAKGGEALNEKDLEETARLWEREKDLMVREQQLREQGMQEKFDHEIERLKADYESANKDSADKEPANAKQRKEKMLKQSGKDLADKIRSGKITGLKSDPIGFTVVFNAAIDVIAAAVEHGATLAQAIKDYVDENRIKDPEKFQKQFLDVLDRQDRKTETFEKIKDISELNKTKEIDTEMVSKNLIRDYVNSHIGSFESKDILDEATKGLQEIFPDLDKKTLIEAYLKEGDYKLPSSKELNNSLQSTQRELTNIAKLTEDIADLEGYKDVRQRSFASEREKSDYEKSLIDKKNTIIKERADAKAQFEKDYGILETERNRQISKESELTDKIEAAKELFKSKGESAEKTVDTPEIERLKQELSDAKKQTSETEAAIVKNLKDAEKEQARYEALEKEHERVLSRMKNPKEVSGNTREKNTSQREEELQAKIDEAKKRWDDEKKNQSEAAAQYKKLETERNRQLKRVDELNKKLTDLQNFTRTKKEKGEPNVDTPEIEFLKKEIASADKDLRAIEVGVRRAERDAIKKQETLNTLDADIKKLKERGELSKKTRSKTDRQIDADIKAKKDELKRVLRDQGLKIAAEDKYTKASYDSRAAIHNERLEKLSDLISNKIEADKDISDEHKEALMKIKGQIDASQIKLDPTSALSQKAVLDHGVEMIKNVQEGVADPDIKHELQKIVDKFDKDRELSEQDIKLARLKDRLRREKDEYIRKINAKEFDDNPIIELTKSDAELIKLERDKTIVAGEFNKLKRKYELEGKGLKKRLMDTGQSLLVASLIYKLGTLAKVATSAVTRPIIESLTKASFGQLFQRKVSPAIAHLAKSGGESQSIDSIKAGYQSFLGHFTEEGINNNFEESNKEFVAADTKLRDAVSDGLDKKQLSDLRKIRDEALVNNMKWAAYMFINPSAYREAWQVLLHRSADIESNFGFYDTEAWSKFESGEGAKQKMGTSLDNVQYLAGFVGRSHSALKTFSGRQNFMAGFIARLEYAVNEGVDVTKSDKILEIANDAYLDWDRGKYQQANAISDTWNKLVDFVDKKIGPSFAALLKADVAINRVPVNMLWEATAEYAAGSIFSLWKTAQAHYNAKKMVLEDGYTKEDGEEFKAQIRRAISENMTAQEAATIVRSFRKGGLGMGMYALALLGGVGFGGFPHLGQSADDKKAKKREEEYGTKELMTGEIQIGDYKFPEFAAKIIEHTPALYPALFGKGFAQVINNNIKDGKTTSGAIKESALAHINILLDGIPVVQKVLKPVGISVFGGLKYRATTVADVDQDGNKIRLRPFRTEDYLPAVLGNKKGLLTPDNYKLATSVSRDFQNRMSQIENDANLTASEKEVEKAEAVKKRNEILDKIYESQDPQP